MAIFSTTLLLNSQNFCAFSFCAHWVWQLIPSTCPGDVFSGGGSRGSAEFCFGFVCYLGLGLGLSPFGL
ncbi:hypothetical protein PRUPE_5G218300 [Prunus persica]|uniref:Uncharacterized protein n=1 Tax=Prunus persica TaxID=3760 RepID=A0A251PC06_PRUPE|nr:hypothetical protein PRUPE_5G218300 [Prunus persica]